MFEQLLIKISVQLRKHHIPYMIIGGQAVLVYGEPRLTRDIDITLGLDIDQLDTMKTVVRELSLKILAPDITAFVNKTMVLPVLHEKSGIRIDFIFSSTDYERQAIKRAKKISLNNHRIAFASLEDIVIHKIIAHRDRDIEDVKNILLKNPKYNGQYIKEWLRKFDESLSSDNLTVFNKIARQLKT